MSNEKERHTNKRINRVTVRLSSDELDIVEEAAKIAKQELATYVRQESVQAAQLFINWIEATNRSNRRFQAMASKV